MKRMFANIMISLLRLPEKDHYGWISVRRFDIMSASTFGLHPVPTRSMIPTRNQRRMYKELISKLRLPRQLHRAISDVVFHGSSCAGTKRSPEAPVNLLLQETIRD